MYSKYPSQIGFYLTQQTASQIQSRTLSVKRCMTFYLEQGRVTVILAWDVNARVGWLSSNGAYLGCPFGLDSYHSEKGGRLLASRSDHQLFLTSRSPGRSKRRYVTGNTPVGPK